ncbi:hypothetical protein [Thioalkalivibrio thiocyanoxidans]|uniref:hypothetical protein n=1 Tax=Thioalkalivibrio thiocyanoxidans TaxID=152475 RepID=UPI00037748E9|nr:hypothetical protein [Thioalkalivibrio thiocyanoxidans]
MAALNRPRRLLRIFILPATALLLGSLVGGAAAQTLEPLFDAHLHYRERQMEQFPPESVARTLEENSIQSAIVMAPRSQLIEALEPKANTRIVPFLEISQRLGRKMDWMYEDGLREQVETILDRRRVQWRGIGELHIQADDRFARGFEDLLDLAVERDLWIVIHSDPAVIDHAYAIQPEVRILWAHAGSYAYPPLIRDYLERHPHMVMDVSMRNPRINPGGIIDHDWFELFLDYPDRFLIGNDTFSLARWEHFTVLKDSTRAWLEQLPANVQRMIARENGERLFPPTESQ